MKKVIRLTESDLVRIVKRVIQEDQGITDSWKMAYTKWAENKSGNYDLAMSLMSRYWDLKNHPEMPVEYKDFNNLKHAYQLQKLIDEMEKVVKVNKKNQAITRRKKFGDYLHSDYHSSHHPKHNIDLGFWS